MPSQHPGLAHQVSIHTGRPEVAFLRKQQLQQLPVMDVTHSAVSAERMLGALILNPSSHFLDVLWVNSSLSLSRSVPICDTGAATRAETAHVCHDDERRCCV